MQILKLRFGRKTFVQTLSTRFGQDFEVEVQARFAAGVWPVFFLVEILKLGLVKILNFKLRGDAEVCLRFLVDA